MLFSHVKISSFRAKAHLVFHCGLYNKIIYCMVTDMILIQFKKGLISCFSLWLCYHVSY